MSGEKITNSAQLRGCKQIKKNRHNWRLLLRRVYQCRNYDFMDFKTKAKVSSSKTSMNETGIISSVATRNKYPKKTKRHKNSQTFAKCPSKKYPWRQKFPQSVDLDGISTSLQVSTHFLFKVTKQCLYFNTVNDTSFDRVKERNMSP